MGDGTKTRLADANEDTTRKEGQLSLQSRERADFSRCPPVSRRDGKLRHLNIASGVLSYFKIIACCTAINNLCISGGVKV